MEHICVICNHPDRDEIERKYLDGWRLIDIKKEHPFFDSVGILIEHAKAIGIFEEARRSRKIKVKEICEEIIRAGRPNLDKNKIYPRDILEAARILSGLKASDDIEEFWALIKRKRVSPGESLPEEKPKFKKVYSTGTAEKLLERINRRKVIRVRKRTIQTGTPQGHDGSDIFR